MKRAVKFLLFLVLAGVLTTYSGCGGSDPVVAPVTDTQIDKLAKTWHVQTVTLDGNSQTSNYTNFTLTFSGTHGQQTVNYTTANRPSLSAWPASGTFAFSASTPQTSLTRKDGTTSVPDDVPFTYSVTDGLLTLQFNYSGTGFTSKTEEVKGQWVFTMVP